MTTTTTKPQIEMLPFASVNPSPLNPRKHFDEAKLQDLAASIAAKGILQNLVVRPVGSTYEVAAGERRWRAVQLLIDAGTVEPTFLLPAVVQELSDVELLEIAMAENVRRADMHPLEEADGYLAMVKLGETAESIALRTGAAQSSVLKRLKIAEGLGKSGRKLLLEGQLTLAQAQALSIGTQKDQEAYLKGRGGYLGDPRQIKAALVNHRPPTDRAFFKLKVYTDKGGTIIPDLFGSDPNAGFFADQALFVECQKEAMAIKKEQLEKKGKTVHIEYSGLYEGDVYRRYDHRQDHVLITLDTHGVVEVKLNYGPPEKRKTASDVKESDAPKAPMRNLRRLEFEDQALTRAAQRAVNTSARMAKIIAIAGLCASHGNRLSKNNEAAQQYETYQDEAVRTTITELREALRKPLKLESWESSGKGDMLDLPQCSSWLEGRAKRLYAHLNALDDETLDRYFQALMAACVGPVFAGEMTGTADFLLEQSKPDMHAFFTADANYFSTCTKAELEEIAPELEGAISAGAKKPDIVAGLAEKPKAKTWLPKRLRLEAEQ